MDRSNSDPLACYAFHSPITNPGECADLLEGLPTDVPALCRVVQGNLLHIFWADAYFGIFDMHGLWFIRGDLVRDLASLNRMELLPWDCWGIIETKDEDLSEEDMALLDHAAMLTMADNATFPELRSIYENDPRLRVPPVIRSYSSGGVRTIELTI